MNRRFSEPVRLASFRLETEGGAVPVANTTPPVALARPQNSRDERHPLRARELSAATILVAAVGEIDAANSARLLGFVDDHLRGYGQLVLDLSRLKFFGTAGFSALHTINVRCSRQAIDWVLVAGTEVARLLQVCDTEGALPVAGNIVSGVAALARGPHRQLQLTPQPR